MTESDYELALSLQRQYDNAAEIIPDVNISQSTSNTPDSIVDPRWELIDPNPNIHALFQQFNKLYFWRALDMVEVRWSARMTLCAGICSYQGRGGLCSIGLSQPLLKLRPRKDLIETLLHEMIHAYLFVTANNRDRDGHGPEFCKHMNRINAETGTNITIYHSFHDEVDELRQHWWRCRGVCQRRPPYFGFVKRSMNRAPSKNDTWWAEHQRTCGGSYDKVKEPENYGKKKISGSQTKKVSKPDPTQRRLSFNKSAEEGPGTSSQTTNSPRSIVESGRNFDEKKLGGSNLKGNPRGIPQRSRILDLFMKTSPRTSQRQPKIKSAGMLSRLDRICREMRLNGDASVNSAAPAIRKLKVVTKFRSGRGGRSKLHFTSDDEIDAAEIPSSVEICQKLPNISTKNENRPTLKGNVGVKRLSDDNVSNQRKKQKMIINFIFSDVSSGSDSDDDFIPFVVKPPLPVVDPPLPAVDTPPPAVNPPLPVLNPPTTVTQHQGVKKEDNNNMKNMKLKLSGQPSTSCDLANKNADSANNNADSANNHNDSANNHDDSANNHYDSANNNADSANNHDDSANNTDDDDDDLPPFNYPSNSRLPCPICLLLVDAPQINSHVDLCLNSQTLEQFIS